MATVCRTLGVNAAFLQEIKEDNQQLKQLLTAAQQLLRQPCHERMALRQWSDALDELRDQLALHFALEDAYGYFEDAVDQAPRLTQRAEQLRGEHGELFLEVCRLADSANELLHEKASGSRTRMLSESFLAFVLRFECHERQENELILAAFDDDIGVGD